MNDFSHFRQQFKNNNINVFGRITNFFNNKTVLSNIILINIVVWLIILVVDIIYFLFNIHEPIANSAHTNHLIYWLSLPSSIKLLMRRPWTLISYMFLHHQFSHIFFNMLILYSAGIIFTRYFKDRQLLWTYIIGGLFGALFFILSYNIFPVFETQVESASAIGASAAVMSILFVIAAFVPNLDVNLWLLGNIKFKWIAAIFVVIDILSISKGNAGGHIAHLGGALWGFIYGLCLKNKCWNNNPKLFDKIKKYYYNIKNKKELKHKKKQEEAEKKEYNKKIDDILRKISRSGYSSLTKEEKEILFSNNKK